MPKFTIHVIETIAYTVEVEAANIDAAYTAAEKTIAEAADRFDRFDGRLLERNSEEAENPENWT